MRTRALKWAISGFLLCSGASGESFTELCWIPEYSCTIARVPVDLGMVFDASVTASGDLLICYLDADDDVFKLTVVRDGRRVSDETIPAAGGQLPRGQAGCGLAFDGEDQGWLLLGQETLRAAPALWTGDTLEIGQWTEVGAAEGLRWEPMLLRAEDCGVVLQGLRFGTGEARRDEVHVAVLGTTSDMPRAVLPVSSLIYGATFGNGRLLVASSAGRDNEIRFYSVEDTSTLQFEPLQSVVMSANEYALHLFPFDGQQGMRCVAAVGLSLYDFRWDGCRWQVTTLLGDRMLTAVAFAEEKRTGTVYGIAKALRGMKAFRSDGGSWSIGDVSEHLSPELVLHVRMMIGPKNEIYTLSTETDEDTTAQPLIVRRWTVRQAE